MYGHQSHRDSNTLRIWVVPRQDLYVHIAWAQNIIMSHLDLYRSVGSANTASTKQNFVYVNFCLELVLTAPNAMTESWNNFTIVSNIPKRCGHSTFFWK